MLNPFRAMTLGYKYHDLYQRCVQAEAEVDNEIRKKYRCLDLAEKRRVDCMSLERQKGKLQLRIEELLDTHEHHSWLQCEKEIKALKEENVLRVLESARLSKRNAFLEKENAELLRTLYGNKAGEFAQSNEELAS